MPGLPSSFRRMFTQPWVAVVSPLALLASFAYGVSSGEPTGDAPASASSTLAAPVVTITPASGSTYSGSTSTHPVQVTVSVCSEGIFSGGSSRTIYLNATNVTSSFTYQSPEEPDPECNTHAELVGTVSLVNGTNNLSVSVTDGSGTGTANATYGYTYTAATYTVAVTPDGSTATHDTTTTARTATFTVANSGNSSATYTLTPSCSGVLSGCTSSATVTVASGSSASVPVSFVARTAGTGRLQLGASYGAASDSGWVTVTATVPPATLVSVTPDGTVVGHTAGAGTQTRTFTVQNLGTSSASYTLNALCTGTATSCSVSSPLSVSAGASQTVNVTYTAATAGPGRVRLRAQASGGQPDSGWVVVDVAPASGTAQAPSVSLADPNPGTSVSRGMCLTVAISGDAASECGDLRVAQALPGIVTMNRARGMTLLYNSQHAHPRPTVAANVTLAASATRPDSVTAQLRVGTSLTLVAEGKWSGTDWGYGTTRRIALSFDGLTYATGRYPVRISVRNWYGGSFQETSASGTIALVNRSRSYYRPGWWPAGVEQLVATSSGDTLLWVGGDGSTRLYGRVGATSVYRAESVTRPDSMTVSGSTYTRWLPGGVRVLFDLAGRHTQTVGRRGTTTTFSYLDALTTRLNRVTLPVASGTAPYYEFAYAISGADTVLTSVTAPPAGSVTRVTQVRWDAGARRLTFVEPDTMSKVHFDHDATHTRRIVKRTDRNGNVTEYTFHANGTVASGRRYMSGTSAAAGDPITSVLPVEARGLPGAAAVDTARAYARVDGPRDDVTGDTVIFWLDRFGAPRRVVDPLGRATTVVRGNGTYPGLVTRSETATDTARAYFDALGRLDSTVVVNPLGTGQNAVTRYRYDATWKDFATRVVAPLGDSVVMSYDANGDRVWQQPGADATRRATFAYNTWGQVVATQSPRQAAAGKRDSIFYDALGNVRSTRSALGYRTLVQRDALGRDTLSYAPLDSLMARDTAQLKSGGARTRTRYDRLGRVDTVVSIGPARTYPHRLDHGEQWTPATHPALTLTVANEYDREGNLTEVSRWSTPDTAHVGTIVTTWQYDRANRQTEERGPDPSVAVTRHFNGAGQDTLVRTRRGGTIRKIIDVAGRVSRTEQSAVVDTLMSLGMWSPIAKSTFYFPYRTPNADGTFLVPNTADTGTFTLPGDTAVFTYDPVTDEMVEATNRSARIRRQYYPGGALHRDSISIFPSNGRSTTAHAYGIRYVYDLNGRRTDMYAPSQLMQGAAWMERTRYQYDAVTGALSRIDAGADTSTYRYTFTYNTDGQLTDQAYLGTLVTEQYSYDLDGQLTWQQRRRGGTLIHADTFTYDGAGRRARVGTMQDSVLNVYGPLGALMWSLTDKRNGGTVTEEFNASDAMANVALTHRIYNTTGPKATDLNTSEMQRFLYEPYTGRLEETEKVDPRQQNPTWGGTDATVFDRSGNKRRFTDQRTVAYGGLINGQGTLKERTEHYYGADDKLRIFDRRACVYGTSNPGGITACWDAPFGSRGTFEEYRYDALGRRVMTLTDQGWACTAHCVIAETRTVWDGDQVLAEVRSPLGSQQDTGPMEEAETMHPRQMGRVLYTQGLNLDKPLLLARIDYDSFFPGTNAIIPHTNWLGNYDSGTFVAQSNATGPACMKRARVAQDATKYPFEDPDVTGGLNQDSITICYDVEWPAPYLWNSKRPIDRGKYGPPSWMGSLVEGGRDASGQMYMRNRYYDPSTGRFTQEDPIGLAGGINLYGYANGDAVNFDDPYGLCLPADLNLWDCPPGFITAMTTGGGAVAGGMAGGFGGGALGGALCAPTGAGAGLCAAGGGTVGAKAGAWSGAAQGFWIGVGIEAGISLAKRLGGGDNDAPEIERGETANFNEAVRRLGVDRNKASEYLHAVKRAEKMRGDDNVWIHTTTGNIRSQKSGEVIGNLLDAH